MELSCRLALLFRKSAHKFKLEVFQENYDVLCQASKCAKKFVDAFEPQHWANALFEGQHYSNMNSNIVESFNAWIIEARHLAFTELIDHIRIQIMEMMSKIKIESSTWDSYLCLKVEEQLQTNICDCRGMKCSISTPFTIVEFHNRLSCTVNLETFYCSCKEWKVKRLPCKHACVAIQFVGKNIHDFCSPYFTSAIYWLAYEK